MVILVEKNEQRLGDLYALFPDWAWCRVGSHNSLSKRGLEFRVLVLFAVLSLLVLIATCKEFERSAEEPASCSCGFCCFYVCHTRA